MQIPTMVGIGYGGDWVGGIVEQDVVIAVLTPDEPRWEVTVITVTPISRIVTFSAPHLQCLKLLSFHSLETLSRSRGRPGHPHVVDGRAACRWEKSPVLGFLTQWHRTAMVILLGNM